MRTAILLLTAFATFSPAMAAIPEMDDVVLESSTERQDLEARRLLMIDRLKAYANARVFPLNTTQPGLQSQLLDASGNPCAMAHLMILDGQRDLVVGLAATDNAIELGEQRSGPVNDWILASGMTHEEVAYIQEPDFYVGDEDPWLLTHLENERLRTHFMMAALQLEATFEQGIDTALDRQMSRPVQVASR